MALEIKRLTETPIDVNFYGESWGDHYSIKEDGFGMILPAEIVDSLDEPALRVILNNERRRQQA